MQAAYSNYDSDDYISGSRTKIGGLGPYQEFRPQPEKIINGAGLLISLVTDMEGTLSIDFTNIIEEPYSFTEIYEIPQSTTGYSVKSYLTSVKAKNFRVRFQNKSTARQQKFKLFTFILPNCPVFSLVDSNGDKISTLVPTTGTANALITHNIYDYSQNLLPFGLVNDTSIPTIQTQPFNLTKYKNFDIILNYSTDFAINLVPIRLYIYVWDGGYYSPHIKTDIYIDIYYGDTTRSITNVTINAKYIIIKASSLYITDLRYSNLICYIVTKG